MLGTVDSTLNPVMPWSLVGKRRLRPLQVAWGLKVIGMAAFDVVRHSAAVFVMRLNWSWQAIEIMSQQGC